jgi:hypothetical protein
MAEARAASSATAPRNSILDIAALTGPSIASAAAAKPETGSLADGDQIAVQSLGFGRKGGAPWSMPAFDPKWSLEGTSGLWLDLT